MGSKSPLNDRAYAREYVQRELRGYAAEKLQDGAAVYAHVSIDDIADAAMADWDERMADPERRMPDGSAPDKRKQLDHAIMDAFWLMAEREKLPALVTDIGAEMAWLAARDAERHS